MKNIADHSRDYPQPCLEVRDLQLVLALAAAGSTARAASQLHLTQPAVSRALLALEDKLALPLFDRSARGLVPTSAGERLLSGARECLRALQELELRTRTAPVATRLRVVCECYTAYHWLPSVIADLRKTVPGLDLSLEVAHTQEPLAALEAGAVDVALLTTATVHSPDVIEKPLFSDEVVFVLSQKHELARQKVLTKADLRRHILLTSSLTPAAETAWFMRAVFGRRVPQLTTQSLPLTEAILDVARAGLGVAVLSEWIAAPHLTKGDLSVRRLNTGPLRRPWRFACSRTSAESAERLWSLLQNAAPRLPS